MAWCQNRHRSTHSTVETVKCGLALHRNIATIFLKGEKVFPSPHCPEILQSIVSLERWPLLFVDRWSLYQMVWRKFFRKSIKSHHNCSSLGTMNHLNNESELFTHFLRRIVFEKTGTTKSEHHSNSVIGCRNRTLLSMLPMCVDGNQTNVSSPLLFVLMACCSTV